MIERFTTSITLSTLAAKVALISGTQVDSSRSQGIRIKDMWLNVGWKGKTTQEGPIAYGIGRNLGSVALLKAALEADPQGKADSTELQNALLDVMQLGTIGFDSISSGDEQTFMRKIRFPWKMIAEGSDLQVWAFNRDSGALTTGGNISFDFIINQEWLND